MFINLHLQPQAESMKLKHLNQKLLNYDLSYILLLFILNIDFTLFNVTNGETVCDAA